MLDLDLPLYQSIELDWVIPFEKRFEK